MATRQWESKTSGARKPVVQPGELPLDADDDPLAPASTAAVVLPATVDNGTDPAGDPEMAVIPYDEPGAGRRAFTNDFSSFDPRDLATPFLTLLQALSPAVTNTDDDTKRELGIKPGNYYISGGRGHTSVEIIIFGFQRNRRASDDDGIICTSPDRVTGTLAAGTSRSGFKTEERIGRLMAKQELPEHMRDIASVGGSCDGCPMAAWYDHGSKRHSPLCSEGFTYTGCLAGDGSLFLFTLQKTALPAAKRINSLLQSTGGRVVLRLGSTQERSDRYTFFVPTVESRKPTDDELALIDMYR